MRGLGYFLLGSGGAFMSAGWISIAQKGEVNVTTSTIGLICTLTGSALLVRWWVRGGKPK